MRTSQRWPSNSIHLAQIKENSAAPIWSRSLLLDKRQRAINSKQSPLAFCSIKDCARHQAFPPQKMKKIEQENTDPPSRMPRNLQLTPVKPLFSRKKGSVMPPRHDSSWRFLGKDKDQPRPKNPKSFIEDAIFIYLIKYMNMIEHESQRFRAVIMQPPCGESW